MKRLRRWAIPVLLAFLMFSCAGCGDSAPVTEDEGGTPPSGSVSAESTPVYWLTQTVSFALMIFINRKTLRQGIEKFAELYGKRKLRCKK